MYHAHFALTEEPFGVSPDRRFFLQTEQHREALATLYYALRQRRGFALLVGRAGLGKTSVLVRLVQMLEGHAEIAYLPHPYFDRATVLESILLSLGLNATGSLAQDHRLFYKYLLETRRAGKTCVVIFDEAQDLNHDTLETIRMLSNFETPAEKLLQIVLAGQPRLAETLKRPECEQIRQRLNVVARLQPLSAPEVHEYVAHRLNLAGGSVNLFAPDAIDAIAAASAGIPRNVNTICFNSLTLAYALGHRQVGCEEVAEALRDLSLDTNLDTNSDNDIDIGVPDAVAPAAKSNVVAPAAKPAAPVSALSFQPAERSFRSTLITGSVVLLVAGTLIWRSLAGF
jgi:type II secretory pathway predicted ATPase ExeA